MSEPLSKIPSGMRYYFGPEARLRRQIDALDAPVRAVSADEFVVGLYHAQPDQIVAVLDAMVAKRTRRPITRADLLDALAASFPRFVEQTAGNSPE